MDDLVLGRPLPEGLTIARGESLYTVAPKAILLDYIRDDALRREVRGLYALGRDADPLGLPGREEPASAPVSARFRVPPMEDLPGRHGR